MLQQLRQWLRTDIPREPAPSPAMQDTVHQALQAHVMRTLGRALTIRHVDAGSSNACELEVQALSNPYYNLERFGIRLVASPRHADLLLVTGPVSRHMAIALQRTYDAMPDPKLVVAAGDGACGAGLLGASYASLGAVANVIPVNVAIRGCPPTPLALLQGILAAVTPASGTQVGQASDAG